MRNLAICTFALLAALLSACVKKEGPVAQAPDAASAATSAANVATPVPDVGKLETVRVTAQGFGGSASEAVSEAMKLAILHVNGASVDMSALSVKYGLDVTLNQDSASLRATAFSDAVHQRSGGVIQDFKLLQLDEPKAAGGKFKVNIEASIAKFAAPQDLKKIKVVVAPLKFDVATLTVGDQQMAAADVAGTLRQRVIDALVNTGRFAILDRDVSPELQHELDMASSGQAPSAELAKLSQAATADVIWSGHATLAYQRHARHLHSSDRELVSYSGGWTVNQKLVAVATRQVMVSNSLRGEAPTTEPTTLGTSVDGSKVLAEMSDKMVKDIVATVLRRTFPITVVSQDGDNVVLSQGGDALHEGSRYAMALMGTEMRDPQTGQSLGRLEQPCCEVVVERVAQNLAYGRLEKVNKPLTQLPQGALQLREELKPVAKLAEAEMTSGGAERRAPRVDAIKPHAVTNKPAAATPSVEAPKDEKW